jgi:hypothetical protein
MKTWVIPYLRQQTIESISRLEDLSEEEREELTERALERVSKMRLEDEIYYELTGLLNCDFGGGLGWPVEVWISLFGFVLAEIPEEVFRKLHSMKSLFFIFSPCPGAEVKVFQLKNGIEEGETLRVVNFPYEDFESMTRTQLKGEIAHELAHAYLEHILGGPDETEDEADEIAKKWGFEKEIEAMRDLFKDWSRDHHQPMEDESPNT